MPSNAVFCHRWKTGYLINASCSVIKDIKKMFVPGALDSLNPVGSHKRSLIRWLENDVKIKLKVKENFRNSFQ
jgi:hypothetical protein